MRDHGTGGGLAVGAGHGQHLAAAHQPGDDVRAPGDRNALRTGRTNFDVLFRDRGGGQQQLRALDVFRGGARMHCRARRRQR